MEFLQISCSLLVFLALAWYLKYKNHFSTNWPVLRILPFLLNGHRLNEVITGLFETLGTTFTLKDPLFTSTDYVATCNPTNLEYILKTNFSNYPKGHDYKEIFDMFGDTLFTTDTHQEIFSARKKIAHRALSSKEFRSFAASTMQSEVEFALLPLLKHIAKESLVVDLQDLFFRLTYDDSFTMVLGINPKLLCPKFRVTEFLEGIEVVTKTIAYRHLVPTTWWKLLRKLKLGWERRYANARKAIDHFIQELIIQREDNAGGGKDLLSMCMMLQESTGIVVESPRDFSFSILTATADTTASGLTWLFWLVSQTPRVEEKILDELTHVLSERAKKASNNEVFDQEELRNSVYLHATICESLRLYPPVSINHRAAMNEDVLPDGIKIRSGTKVILCPYAMARQKWIWGEDCMDFRPERWINEDGKIKSELMSKFFTFNTGPRTCMGRDMAFNLMKVVIANIIFKFNVQVIECNPELQKISMFLYIKNGLKVKVSERMV